MNILLEKLEKEELVNMTLAKLLFKTNLLLKFPPLTMLPLSNKPPKTDPLLLKFLPEIFTSNYIKEESLITKAAPLL